MRDLFEGVPPLREGGPSSVASGGSSGGETSPTGKPVRPYGTKRLSRVVLEGSTEGSPVGASAEATWVTSSASSTSDETLGGERYGGGSAASGNF